MARKLYLLADDQAMVKLRAVGMSEELLVDGTHDAPPDGSAPQRDYIQRLDPRDLTPHARPAEAAEDSPAVDVEHRDELFAGLLGSLVCHLVVLENDAGERDTVLTDSAPVERLRTWYEQFQQEVELRVGYRQSDYRHVLVIVCAEDVPHEYLEPLLAQLSGPDSPVEVCYVMLRRLNWAQQNVCHARYVWPISVARLLLYLMTTKGQLQPRGGTTLMAWRAIEIVPDIPASVIDEQYRKTLDIIYKRLFTDFADHRQRSVWDEDSFDPDPHIDKEELTVPEPPHVRQWQTFDSRRATDDAESPARWDEALSENGGRFATSIGRAVLDDDSPAWRQVAKVWGSVHGEPSVLPAALQQRGIVHGPDVDRSFQELLDEFQSLITMIRERDAAIADARGCAEAIAQAQRGYIDRSVRVMLAATVGVIVSYASIVLFGYLLSLTVSDLWARPLDWLTPLAVAGSGVLGVALAVVVPLVMENIAGKRAVGTFTDDILPDLDQRMIRRDWASQKLIENGHRFWAKARAASAARRLRLLLRRLMTMVDFELRTTDSAAPSPEDDAHLYNHTARRRRQIQQQREFQQQSRIRQATPTVDVDGEALSHLSDTWLENFRRLWMELCQSHDRQRAGTMPAQIWIPRLRAFCEQLHAAVAERIHSDAVRNLIAAQDEQWKRALGVFLNQDYSYYLSCPVTATDVDADGRSMRLLLRSELAHQDDGRLQDVVVDHHPVIDGQPLLGLLFDEAPVQLGAGSDGHVRVMPHET